ncbi:MAG: amidohydrolase family protein [Pseudodesulfovibrio sp.]
MPVLTPDNAEPLPEYVRLLERMVRDGTIMVPTLDVFDRSLWRGPNLTAPVAAFHGLGGRIAVGNDFPYRGTDAGMPLNELRLLRAAGLGPAAVLRAATSGSARACNFPDRGVIAPGGRADLIVAAADPLNDTEALAGLGMIVKDGIVIDERVPPRRDAG